MSDTNINLLSALAVSVIISAMSLVQNQKLKAILYVLPIPITIALIGSRSVATSLSISGLALTATFLWGCYFLHNRLKIPILFTDILLAAVYVSAAYVMAKSVRVTFWVMLAAFGLAWASLMVLFRNKTFRYQDREKLKTNPLVKLLTIFVIAFGLFSAHQYLAAFVVTFPYNGVFAVYENRYGLLPQAALFTRNSLALAAYFTANYLMGQRFGAVSRYLVSWVAFGAVLLVVNNFIQIQIRAVKN